MGLDSGDDAAAVLVRDDLAVLTTADTMDEAAKKVVELAR